MLQRAKKVMTLTAGVSAPMRLPMPLKNVAPTAWPSPGEKVSCSWLQKESSTELVKGRVQVLWDDLLDADDPGLEGCQAQGRLDVVVLLQDVEGLYQDLVEVVLGGVLAVVLGLGAASALGLGVDLVILTGCRCLVLHGEVVLKPLWCLPLASGPCSFCLYLAASSCSS